MLNFETLKFNPLLHRFGSVNEYFGYLLGSAFISIIYTTINISISEKQTKINENSIQLSITK